MHYEAELNSYITMRVESLSLLLNKREYELAKASIAQWSATMTINDGDLNMQGRLGTISLNDLSPYGTNYKCKFITIGSQALDFDFMRSVTLLSAICRHIFCVAAYTIKKLLFVQMFIYLVGMEVRMQTFNEIVTSQ